jgi:hypothetical protein
MQSGTTPQSLQINVRFKDNGGTDIEVYLENTAGTLKPASYNTNNGAPLRVTTGITYTVIASKYQFLIFNPAYTPREFVWVGMPYLTSDLASNITTAGFLFSNTFQDGSGLTGPSIMVCPHLATNNGCGQTGASPNYELMINSSWWESSNASVGTTNNPASIGAPRLWILTQTDANASSLSTVANQWNTSTPAFVTSDVYIGWGATGSSATARIQGQIWDCLYINDPVAVSTTGTWSSHTWYNVTNSNNGSSGSYWPGGFWFVIS